MHRHSPTRSPELPDDIALLLDRTRAGLWLILGCIALFALGDMDVPRDVLGRLYAVKLSHVGFVVALLFAVRRASTRRQALALALLTVNGTYAFIAASDVIAAHLETTPLLGVVCSMAAATLMPWGPRAQAVTILIMSAGTVWTLSLSGRPFHDLADPLTANAGALLVSGYVAYEFRRYRTERRAAQRRLEDEAAVSAALVRVAHEMFSLCDTPMIFDRLCALTAEVLGSDHSTALLWHPDIDGYTSVACHGFSDDERALVTAHRVPREHMSALFAARRDDDVAEIRATRARVPLVCIALRQGKDLIGVQTAGWRRDAQPFSPRRRRIAQGIARIASMALANARLVEELERASRLKSEFVSTMSHELRTPLNVILGYADMARDPAAAGVRDAYLERIAGAGRELLELIESTLEIGRIEAGRAEVQLEPVGLAAFWEKLAKSCAALPRRAEVSLVWEPGVPDGPLVTDPRKIEIVVRNLVGNALKFTEQGHVRARLARDASAAVLTVSDTGIGIRPEDQEAIFQMFRQADGSDSRRFGGAGLGLYIVRRFVQQLGGTVTLESAPGRGSVFTVRLPWRAASSVSDAA
jgi:signal transduction histidine kinase